MLATACLKLVRSLARVMCGLVCVACAITSNAFAQKPPDISIEDMAAFSFNLATGPLESGSPYLLKLVGYSNPNDCFEAPFCRQTKLFVVIVGDGEGPDYKVYEIGDAVDWRFQSWGNAPMRYFDDARDKVTFVLDRTDVCHPPECKIASLRTIKVTGEVSLWGFRWIE